MAAKLAAAAQAQQAALARLAVELSGSAEQQAALQQEREKERRVEALAASAMRRLKNAGLVHGWGAWHGQWAEAAKERRQMAAVGARLTKPMLVKTFGDWRADWEAAQ